MLFARFPGNLSGGFGSAPRQISFFGGQVPFFAPGVFFILLGLLAVLAPRLILFIVASFFLFVGACFCLIAWKVIQLKRKMAEVLSKNIEIQTVLHPHSPPPSDVEWEVVEETKEGKIIIH